MLKKKKTQIFVSAYGILKSILYIQLKINQYLPMWKDFNSTGFPQGFTFKSRYKYKSSRCLREIKYNQNFVYMSGKACMDIFQGPIF